MRIIILNQFFYPDHSATSQLMTDLAESLVARGVEVTALPGRGLYNGGPRLPPRGVYRGVHIERAWCTSFGKRSALGRLADYLSYYLGASWNLLRLPRHDIVMALTTPPLIGLIAIITGRLRRMRVIALVQDLYPDVAIALGALAPGGLFTKLLKYVSSFTLRHSDRIIALSQCMSERIAPKVGAKNASRIDVIHNWADGTKIKPLASGPNPFASEHGLENKFVVLFSGNLGRVNDFGTVLEAAALLRDRPDIIFLFIGDGDKAPGIRDFAREKGLGNISFLPYQPRETLPYTFAAASAHLVTLAEGLAGLSVPSKFYPILAAGGAVLFVGDKNSDIARLVAKIGCGAVAGAGESSRLAGIIEHWAANPSKPANYGQIARRAFELHFNRARAVDKYIESFSKCLKAEKELRIPSLRRGKQLGS